MKSNCTSLFLNKTCLLLSPIQPWSVYFIKHTMLGIPLDLVTYHFNTIWKAFAGKHALFITSLLKRLGRTFYKVLQSITLFDLEYQKVNSQQTWLLWRQKKRKMPKETYSQWLTAAKDQLALLTLNIMSDAAFFYEPITCLAVFI